MPNTMTANHADGFFITGTDTGVGKTLVATALIHLLSRQNKTVIGMKPVASGCVQVEGQWQNEDARALMAASNISAPYKLVNPYAFEPAIAPHLAASLAGENILLSVIENHYQQLKSMADKMIVEGAGGWLAPINNRESMADISLALGLPVILVVGLRLGCLNHALLSVQSILAKGLKLSGWVANSIDPLFAEKAANIDALNSRLPAPCLGVIPYCEGVIKIETVIENLKLHFPGL